MVLVSADARAAFFRDGYVVLPDGTASSLLPRPTDPKRRRTNRGSLLSGRAGGGGSGPGRRARGAPPRVQSAHRRARDRGAGSRGRVWLRRRYNLRTARCPSRSHRSHSRLLKAGCRLPEPVQCSLVGFSRGPETVGVAYGTLRSQALSAVVWRALTGGGVFAEVARALLPSDAPLHLVRRRHRRRRRPPGSLWPLLAHSWARAACPSWAPAVQRAVHCQAAGRGPPQRLPVAPGQRVPARRLPRQRHRVAVDRARRHQRRTLATPRPARLRRAC